MSKPLNPKYKYPKAKSAAPLGIQLPIQLSQATCNNLWTWEFNGNQVRNHFASGFWYTQDGRNVFWGWHEQETHSITILKTVEILADASGRQYVEVKRKGEQVWKQYIDEAVCICFHGRSKPNQRVSHIDGDIFNCEADNLKWE